MAALVESGLGERVVNTTPLWMRVVARPLVVARETPDHSARPVAPLPEGTIFGVASRNDDGWLSLDCGTKKTNKQRHLAEDAASCWVAEKDQEGQTSVLPVLPALFAVGDRTIEVKQQPFVGAATLCTFDRGQFFDVISYENQWLKVYHGKTLQYGKWWTRDIGWIQVVEEADEGVGDDTAPPFAHRRGLVPTLEGRGREFVLASFSSTPLSLYKNSQDRSIQSHLDLLANQERPIDNKSTRMLRNLESIRSGPAKRGQLRLSEILGSEDTVSLPLNHMKINKTGNGSNDARKGGLEEVPNFRHRAKSSKTEEKVDVECSWYVNAHEGSPVSYLKTSKVRDDHQQSVLFSGCEKPGESLSQDQGIVLAWNGEDGSLCKSFRAKVPSTVRCIEYGGLSNQVICVSGEGTVFGFDYDSEEEVVNAFHMNAASGGAASLEPGDLFPQSAASSSDKPKFIPESGFRGKKENYVFRKGEWGIGYYRKDVIFEVLTFPMSENIDIENGEAMERARAERKSQRQYLSNLLQICSNAQVSLISNSMSRVYHGSPMKGDDFCIRCYDIGTRKEVSPPLSGHTAGVLCLAIDEEDNVLYSGSYDKSIIAWDTGRAAAIRTFAGHTAGVHGLCLSKNAGGDILYSCSSDNTIRAWNVEKGQCVKSFFGQHAPGTWPISIACSPDKRWVVSGSKGPFGATNIKLWSAYSCSSQENKDHSNPCRRHHHHSGTCVCTFSQLKYEEPGAITCLAFSEDSSVVYTGASDGTVAAWRISESKQNKKTTKTALSGFLN